MDIKYGVYRDRDFEDFSRMVRMLYTEDPTGEAVTVDKIRLTVKEAELHPDKLAIFLFECEGAVVGYSILTFFWSNEHGGDIVNIDEIFVESGYRSLGIGSAFIDNLFDKYPKAKGLKLEASPSNHRAITGYRRMGFTEAQNLHMLRPSPK